MQSGSAQEARGSQLHVLHDSNDPFYRTLGHFEFQFTGFFDQVFGYGPYSLVFSGFILEGFKTAKAVYTEPVSDSLRFHSDDFSGFQKPTLGRQVFEHLTTFPPGWIGGKIRADDLETQKRLFGNRVVICH